MANWSWVRVQTKRLCFLPVCLPHIYRLIDIGTTWTGAQRYCRKYHTDLAAVHNAQDVTKLRAVLRGIQKIWIGLQADTASWRWSLENQDYYGEGEAGFRRWAVGEPNGTIYYRVCAAMLENGNWSDQLCKQPIFILLLQQK
uniref:C-type lectin domain-containing protein n=1 Tax=Amphilophus citrinellus TaxID=61819 RepID=A0A3Q0SEW7_AMPCI